VPAVELARSINAPKVQVAVTFGRGDKVALAEASISEGASADAPPGTLLTRRNGPVEITARDGIVGVGRYSVEGRIDHWHFENRMADFLDHFPDIFSDSVQFTVERYEAFTNVVNRFTVLSGIDRPKGETFSTGPPNAGSILRGAGHLYLANREWLLQLYCRLGLEPGARVLDIGCGGVWTSLAAREAKLTPWGCDVYVDGYYNSASDWFHYFHCDAAAMEELPGKFDFIFSRAIQPVAYARDLFCPELLKFRDRILGGLAERGAIFMEIYSNNSGASRSPNDWGNSTVEQLHEWIGRFFAQAEYNRGHYISMIASHRPISEPWRTARLFGANSHALSERDFAVLWSTIRARSADDATYFLLLLKLSQAFFRRRPLRAGGPVFVLGQGPLAEDLAFLLKDVQRTMTVIGKGARLPASLPPDTFVYVLPDAKPPQPMPVDHYHITYAEMVGRIVTRDLWCTSQDHDTARVRSLLEKRGKETQKPVEQRVGRA
jgi:hypothetical protein